MLPLTSEGSLRKLGGGGQGVAEMTWEDWAEGGRGELSFINDVNEPGTVPETLTSHLDISLFLSNPTRPAVVLQVTLSSAGCRSHTTARNGL